jgi:hypothetical protein
VYGNLAHYVCSTTERQFVVIEQPTPDSESAPPIMGVGSYGCSNKYEKMIKFRQFNGENDHVLIISKMIVVDLWYVYGT